METYIREILDKYLKRDISTFMEYCDESKCKTLIKFEGSCGEDESKCSIKKSLLNNKVCNLKRSGYDKELLNMFLSNF
jgi:hypothetical protein